MLGIFIGALIGVAMPGFTPISRQLEMGANDLNPNQLPTIGDLIDITMKQKIGWDNYLSIAKRLGYSEYWATHMFAAAENIIGAGDLVTAWRRGIISEENLNEQLSRYHYSPETMEIIKRVTEYFPSPSDLVRFAVREVYSPHIAEQFGQFDDLPEQFLQEAEKGGMTKEQARNYWAAHWELPSITQGFEMLHRRVIDPSVLENLLRALDVMPYWRDKLTAISYRPYTRVDVRRMYAIGVLDEDAVYESYLDLGYAPDKAAKMTEFTVKYETNDDLGLTRTTALKAYKDDLITYNEAVTYMRQLGYAENTIELYMDMADYEKFEEEIKLYVEDLRQQYRKGIITIEQFKTVLTGLDLPASYVNAQVTKEEIQMSNKVKVPSKSDIDKWMLAGLINEKQYATYLYRQGYQPVDIAYYLQYFAETRDIRERKFLPVETYQRWLKAEIIDADLFATILTDAGVSMSDIQKLIQETSA